MLFVKRDSQNHICAIFKTDETNELESLPHDHPDVTEFLTRCSLDKISSFLKADLELIRVIEDLIQILLAKNTISITDFPAPVIEKLISRNKIRSELQSVSSIIIENKG